MDFDIIVPLLLVVIFLITCDTNKQIHNLTRMGKKLFNRTSSFVSGMVGGVSGMISGMVEDVTVDPFDKKSGFGNRELPNSWSGEFAKDLNDAKIDPDVLFKPRPQDLDANIEESIIESHQQYLDDNDFLATTGASHASTRDDFNPPVQFYGLPRSSMYKAGGAGGTSRQSQSETPEEIKAISKGIGSYKL
jgi:hypothetical protein